MVKEIKIGKSAAKLLYKKNVQRLSKSHIYMEESRVGEFSPKQKDLFLKSY